MRKTATVDEMLRALGSQQTLAVALAVAALLVVALPLPALVVDLLLALKMTQMYINKAQAMGVPEERVSNLRQFLRQVKSLNDKAEEATRQQAAGMGQPFAGGPPGVSPDGSMPTAI